MPVLLVKPTLSDLQAYVSGFIRTKPVARKLLRLTPREGKPHLVLVGSNKGARK